MFNQCRAHFMQIKHLVASRARWCWRSISARDTRASRDRATSIHPSVQMVRSIWTDMDAASAPQSYPRVVADQICVGWFARGVRNRWASIYRRHKTPSRSRIVIRASVRISACVWSDECFCIAHWQNQVKLGATLERVVYTHGNSKWLRL